MKKILIITSLVLALGLIASQSFAYGGKGGGRGAGGGGSYTCPYWNANGGASAEYQAYLDQTEDLRAGLDADLRAYDELMAQNSPDPEQAGKLASSIEQKRLALDAKARELGLPLRGNGAGRGMGRGQGPAGYRGGPCWNY